MQNHLRPQIYRNISNKSSNLNLYFHFKTILPYNSSHIDTISGGRLFINGEELSISKHRKEDLLNAIVYKNLISK